MSTLWGVTLLCALAVGVGTLGVLHVVATGLSPLRNAVSQYGIVRFGIGYRVQTLAYAVSGLAAAAGIAESVPGPTTAVVALCGVYGAARALIGWVPMDAPGDPATPTGRGHGLLAAAAFVAVGLAAFRLDSLLRHQGIHPAVASASGVLGTAMGACLLAMVVVRRSGIPCFGAVERGFYAAMTAWLVTVGVLLLPAR